MTTAQALAPSVFAPAPPAARLLPLPGASPHLLLVANGNASGLSRRPALVSDAARLLRSFGARVETQVTTSLDELDAALATAERRVVLLGGDGSLHAAANSPVDAEFALIPAGGANNVARSLGIPVDPGAAARVAVEGPARPVDAIAVRTQAGRRIAVEGVSVGFHAQARAQYAGKNSTDMVAALRAGVRAVKDFEPPRIALALDGDTRLTTVAQLFVANMPLFGPSLRVAPADPADGLLDVVTIDGGRRELLAAARKLRNGTHLSQPGVTYARAREVAVATGGSSPIIADTTDVGTTAFLSIAPAALRIVGGSS